MVYYVSILGSRVTDMVELGSPPVIEFFILLKPAALTAVVGRAPEAVPMGRFMAVPGGSCDLPNTGCCGLFMNPVGNPFMPVLIVK